MSLYDKHLQDLKEAAEECRQMLSELRAQLADTEKILEAVRANPLDRPRCARVNYALSGPQKSDFPLAKYVRLITPK